LPTAGNNYVVLHGEDGRPRVTFGPHWPGLLCTFGLLSFATSFFVNKWLPLFPIGCTVIAYILFCSSLLFLTLTGCTDPGILRSSPVLDDEPDETMPYCGECCAFLMMPMCEAHIMRMLVRFTRV